MGVYVYYARDVRRGVLCVVPVVLQYEFRRSLLAVDDYPVYFVLQAVSYEFQSKAGNLLGKTTYRAFLVINGVVGPVLLGGAVATFFTGSEFYIDKGNIADTVMPVISSWANAGHGLDALLNPWNVVLGLAVFFLARILGSLYFINNISDADLVKRCAVRCGEMRGCFWCSSWRSLSVRCLPRDMR